MKGRSYHSGHPEKQILLLNRFRPLLKNIQVGNSIGGSFFRTDNESVIVNESGCQLYV